ncbi:MAG: cytochrome bc complex cytochrome b subunit [bacterium]|nr:cytochrome bc complex cytochrome b subunit [bacterium]
MKIIPILQNWLEARLPLEPVKRAINRHIRKPVPPHTNFLFSLGTLALLLFALQALTGLLMMVYYKPTVREAYASVQFIEQEVPFGWLIRQVHAWGSNLMVLVVFLHMLKTFVYGGYKRPREITWVLGVLLLAVVLGFGFTGYLLPWDQLAFWATTVGTEAPASMPVFGPFIAEIMRGGPEVGEPTLGRFFVAHVALLPLALIGLVSLHLVLVRLFGISPLRRTDEPEPTPEENLRAGGEPFFPHHILKEGMAAYFLLGILLTLVILVPFHLGPPADPFQTPEGIKPEWYFLPMFQLLKYLPEPIAVALPGLVVFLLLLLPFLDRSPERHPRRRPVAMGLGAALLAVTLALGILGKLSETTHTIGGTTYHFDAKGLPHQVQTVEHTGETTP